MRPEHVEKAFDRLGDFEAVHFKDVETMEHVDELDPAHAQGGIARLALSVGLTDEIREVLYRRGDEQARLAERVPSDEAGTYEQGLTHGLLIGAIVSLTAKHLADEE